MSSLTPIVAALGGELYDRGRRANIPAPGHSRHDRSVSLLLNEQNRVVVHTFGGADWRDVLDDLRARRLIDATNTPSSGPAGFKSPVGPVTSSKIERIDAARRIWSLGYPIVGTPGEQHCRVRGIARSLPGSDVLRYAAQTPISAYGSSQQTMPALLVGIRDACGDFTAVEITYLDPDGTRTNRLKISRKMVGVVRPGSAVRIDAACPCMCVGEGFFTTLSATELLRRPGWALMSAGNLRRWTAPQNVADVVIAGDRGRDGEASARLLRHRLRAGGLKARIELPANGYGDFNEAACDRPRRPSLNHTS
ncbi:toprim domain-containing protein [Caulobacter sp. 17J65-9]|uniref:DUF7146 domain-containing protein n=1 Tax=Caulobacter sp. 17J65-9 TaxID=2709382 RepID=UPI0013C7812A|nr:toprim domain-containing protein [Caulobacter sp. 17J65-9]NEX91162.1 virulence-associated protein E [Caulobacter sp. 17J65-9]